MENVYKGSYIITCDLKKRFSQFKHLCIKTPDVNNFFDDFNENLARLIQKAHPDGEIIVLDVEEIANKILKIAVKEQQRIKGLIVSTSVDFATPRRGIVLELNRLINENGEIIGIGARPGHPSFQQQFKKIAKMTEEKPVIIVEDGIFSGTTLNTIITELKKQYVDVALVIVGFAFPEGLKKLQSVYNGEIIAINQFNNLIDWMPDHDFFPFAPNCGRVLGVKMNGSVLPFYNYNGVSYSVPYILPFAPIEEWASIPKDYSFSISYYCMNKAVDFYEKIDEMNGYNLTLKDVISINPRISASVSVNAKYFPVIHEKIGRFLYNINKECW